MFTCKTQETVSVRRTALSPWPVQVCMQPRLRQSPTVVYKVRSVVVETEDTGDRIARRVLRCLGAASQIGVDLSHLHYCNSAVW